jgi:transposase, IS30 family
MAGRRLSLAEREEIAIGAAMREPVRCIAVRIGRAPSTVSRELRRNVSPSPRRYRAFPAHIRAPGSAARRHAPPAGGPL